MRVLVLLLLLWPTTSFAHGGHDDHEHEQEIFSEFVSRDFMLKSNGEVGPGFKPYVKLSDGTKFELTPEFLRASFEYTQILAAADLEKTPAKAKIWLKTLRFLAKYAGVLVSPLTPHFWLELSATGTAFYYEFGLVWASLPVDFEIIEHGSQILFPPLVAMPPLCPIILAACTVFARQTQDLTNSVLSRYPLNEGIFRRTLHMTDTTRLTYRFWRTLRKISVDHGGLELDKRRKDVAKALGFHDARDLVLKSAHWIALAAFDDSFNRPKGKCAHAHGPDGACVVPHLGFGKREDTPQSKFVAEAVGDLPIDYGLYERPLDPSSSKEQRGFAAKEQLSIVRRELAAAKRAIAPLLMKRTRVFFKLDKALALQRRALNSYSYALTKIALSASPLAFETGALDLVRMFPEQQHQFLRDLETYLARLRAGVEDFESELSHRLFETPQAIADELGRFKSKGCAALLLLRRPAEASDVADIELPMAASSQ